jgi:hypothetical protein
VTDWHTPPDGGTRLPARTAILVWALLTAVVATVQLHAAATPPPGRAFSGFFLFWRDGYNYLSFVQQAQDGAVLFRNKAVPFEHPAVLLNLEWLVTGWVAALLGGRPVLAFLLLGHAASLAVLLAARRWLVALGVGAAGLAALLLVAFGGGLGGLRWFATGATALDISAGLFPFLQTLTNPHHATATALLAWSLLVLSRETPRTTAVGLVLGTLLGLTRPFDLFVLGGARALAVLATPGRGARKRRLAPLVGLVPVAAYDLWVFEWSAGFAIFTRTGVYQLAPLADLAWALVPGLAVASLALVRRPVVPVDAAAQEARVHLLAWVAIAGAVVAAHPVSFAMQFAAGLGVPVLLLAGPALALLGRAGRPLLVAALSTSAVALVSYAWVSKPSWHVPAERLAIARALRPYCRNDDRVLAPPDIGLYANAFSRCRAYLSYEVSPGFEMRAAETKDFYERATPEERRRLLEREAVRFVVLPGRPGPGAETWLGANAGVEERAWAASSAGFATVYERRWDLGSP